tara:strand:+ start:1600 stop:2355 length:756 start_codon:yes stop_codon:yes gene_type:complete
MKDKLKDILRPLYYLAKGFIFPSGKGYCNCCNRNSRFVMTGFKLAAADHLKVEGAGRRRIICFRCGSDERMRQIIAFFSPIDLNNQKILHFAPEEKIFNFFNTQGANVTVADIDIDRYENFDNLALIDLNKFEGYPELNNSFDFIVLNHVLEHINNHVESLKVLNSFLKPDGKLIITTPVSPILKSHIQLINEENTNARFHILMHHEHTILFSKNALIKDINEIFSDVTPWQDKNIFGSTDRPESLYVATK